MNSSKTSTQVANFAPRGARRVAVMLALSLIAQSWMASARLMGADAPAPKSWDFDAVAVAMPQGKPAEYVPARMHRMFKVVEDSDAGSGKALQISVDKSIIRDSDIPILRTPLISLKDAPVGLYKITVRMKMVGMLNAIGTDIRFTAKNLLPTAGSTHVDSSGRYHEPTIHGYMFKDADAYQDFSFVYEVIEPDKVSLRPIRESPKSPLSLSSSLPSKASLERQLAGLPPTPEEKAPEDEKKAKLEAADEERYKRGLSIDLSLLHVISTGFGRSRNTIQTLTVDKVHIERLPAPESATVRQVLPQKILVYPGEGEVFHVWMHNRSGKPQTGELHLVVTHGIDDSIEVGRKPVTIDDGKYVVVDVPWTSPKEDLWGCSVTAEFVQDGKSISSAQDLFSVHSNPFAVMNFGGTNRNQNPFYDPPNYRNFQEFFGVTPGDCIKTFPDHPELPYFSGITGYPTHIGFQKLLVQHNRSIGVASYMYLFPGSTSYPAEEAYEKHPERNGGRMNWTDQATDLYLNGTQDLIERWTKGEKVGSHALQMLITGVNDYFPDIYEGKVKGVLNNLRSVGYDGVRWDGDPFNVQSGTYGDKDYGPPDRAAAQKMVIDMIRKWKESMRKEFPRYTEGANGLMETLGPKLYDRKYTPPDIESAPAFMEFLKDGSSIMDESWMNAWMYSDPRNVIKDYFWGLRQQVDACRRAGGFLHSFSPARDGVGYFTQSVIYYNHLAFLAGAQYPGGVSCSPGSETGLAQFLTRYSQYLWDNKLMALREAPQLIRIESPNELWWDETAVWRDLPDGRRRYVIPVVNPPTVDRFFRDQFSELPDPIKDPIPVSVKLPAGFSSAKVYMLSAEPRTSCTPLKASVDSGAVHFEIPELILYRVLVVEFEK